MNVKLSDAVVWQEGAESISIYHTESGDFRSLNDTAAKIWTLVSKENDRDAVASQLALEFAGTNPAIAIRIRRDVEEFIGSMIEHGFMEEDA